MKSLKALISKNTVHRAHAWHTIPLKKSELRDGDLCMQRDNSVGIYNSKPNLKAFDLKQGPDYNEPTLIFCPDELEYGNFQQYKIKYYTDDLEDKNGEEEFNAIRIVRGLFDPKDVNDPKKVKEFLEDNSNYEKYFN